MPKKWREEELQEITLRASEYHNNDDVALVDDNYDGGRVHYVHCDPTNENKLPHSPVTRLIQTLAEGRAKSCLDGNIIFTTVAPTKMCLGMAANVGAKVVCIEATKTRDLQERQWDKVDWEMWWKERKAGLQKFNCEGKGVSPNIDLQKEERIGKHNGFHSVHRIYMMVSCGLTSNRALTGVGSGQRIGAVLVSKHGELLAWGVNTHNTEGNLTYHAEVNMLQSYQELCGDNFNGLPEDCRIYTTLKPCKMCAGMIVKCAAGKFKVFYDQHDPGGLASSTALDALKDHQSQLYTGGSVLDIKGVETDQNKGRSLPPMGSQLQDKYRQVRESKKKESDEKRITEFLTNDPLATQLFGNAVASLRDKLKKHGISPPNSNVTKTLNPVVTDALRHLDGFLRLKGVVV